MRPSTRWWAAGCVSLAAVSVVLAVLDVSASVRAPFVLVFVLICPGLAIVRFLRITDVAMEWSLAIALSVAIYGGLSLMQAYTSSWRPTVALIIVAAIAVVAVGVELAVPSATRTGDET